jgi:uncharacterized membrane protein YsdA (DUF1294 family)
LQSAAPAILAVVAFFAALVASVITTDLSSLILGTYLALSVMTFAVYAVDRAAAQSGDYQVSEMLLHGLALAGGWPGALLAQRLLGYKAGSGRFRRIYVATVILNSAALLWLHTPQARSVFAVQAA